jgi:WD40 repeat protein
VVVTVFEIVPRRVRHLAGHGFSTSAVAFHPHEPILASASQEHDVTFWDVEKGRELKRSTWLAGTAAALQFSPDGSLLAGVTSDRSAGFGAGLILLETTTGDFRGRLTGLACSAAAFDPSGRSLATGNRDGRLALWDPASGDLQQNRQVANGLIAHLAFIQHGSQLVIGDSGGTVQLRDAQRDHLIAQTALPGGCTASQRIPRDPFLRPSALSARCGSSACPI